MSRALEQALRNSMQAPVSHQGIETPTMKRTLALTQHVHKAKYSMFWGSVNGVILVILLFDIIYTCPYYAPYIYITEIVAALIFALNMIYHIYCYAWNVANMQPVVLTPHQKKLLGVKESDPYFKASTPVTTTSPSTSPATPMNLSAVSWRSSSLFSSGRSNSYSPNYTLSSSSWEYCPGSPGNVSFTADGTPRKPQPAPTSLNQSVFSSPSSPSFIEDEDSLNEYLREFDEYEKSIGGTEEQQQQQSTSFLGSFWKNSAARVKPELASLLRRCTYQLAPPSPAEAPHSPGGSPDEAGSPSTHHSQDLWQRVGVDPRVLTQWNSNLRMWLCQTVLERLVREIKTVDEAFQNYGLTDMQVGAVGLERLKKTAQMPQVVQNIPTLPRLVPFLELTANQEYLVTRIKELAKGGSMSEFRWNGGGSLHCKPWEDHLPTDSSLLLYLFATYLDTQLPPMPHNPDRRPFTSEYLVRFSEKPPERMKSAPMIQEVKVNPPHYVVLVGNEKLDVGKGRNNLFHTILLFLHQMNVKEHGMLGRVNLGPSGINLLWVIDS